MYKYFIYTLFLFFMSITSFMHAQWRRMSRFTEYGLVNYYMSVSNEKSAERVILETIADNGLFDPKDIIFENGKNVFVNTALVDPLNSQWVYVIHAIKSFQDRKPVINLFFYYIENRLRYFYEIDQTNERVFLIYDPDINKPPTKNK